MKHAIRSTLMCGTLLLTLTAAAEQTAAPQVEKSSEYSLYDDVANPVTGALAGTMIGGLAFAEIQNTYTNASQADFVGFNDQPMSDYEIKEQIRRMGRGDQVTISYETSRNEETIIREKQLHTRRNEVRFEIAKTREKIARLHKANKMSEAAIIGNQLRDLTLSIGEIDREVLELHNPEHHVGSRVVVRKIDLNKTRIEEVENFLEQRAHAGKPVLRISKLPKWSIARINRLRAVSAAGFVAAGVGAVMMFKELRGADQALSPDESLAGSDLFVPDLQQSSVPVSGDSAN